MYIYIYVYVYVYIYICVCVYIYYYWYLIQAHFATMGFPVRQVPLTRELFLHGSAHALFVHGPHALMKIIILLLFL
jgi:hypothetical protein